MRATILYGFVGVIGISALSGCGLIQGWRGDGCDCCNGTGGTRRTYAAPEPPTPIAPPKVLPKVVVINEYPGSVAAPPIATVRSTPAPSSSVPPQPVPDRAQADEPPPIRVDLPVQPLADRAVAASVPASAATHVDIPQKRTEKFWTVTGTVEAFRKSWRVRYAAIDHEDRFGGVVVLDGGAELNPLRDGMMVRVRGTLVPPTERTGSAHFRVHDVQVID